MLKHLLSGTVFFVVLLSCAKAQDTTDQKGDLNRIYWSDWYRLEWNDFQGEVEGDESVAALSSIALPYNLTSDGEGEVIVDVNVCFIKDESWAKEKQKNTVLLQHEQLHFDIAELHRRKVIKALLEANLTKDNYRDRIHNIMARFWKKQYREMQERYDKETNYSQFFKGQIEWNKFIEQELRNYADYTYTELKLSLINFED
ncbi:MAG: hypothetical protein RIC95_03990 [Vicingaceae bacterium]